MRAEFEWTTAPTPEEEKELRGHVDVFDWSLLKANGKAVSIKCPEGEKLAKFHSRTREQVRRFGRNNGDRRFRTIAKTTSLIVWRVR